MIKEVCQKCFESQPDKWDSLDDLLWDNGQVWCLHAMITGVGYQPFQAVYDHRRAPPPWCSWKLEHLVLGQTLKKEGQV